ncbi:MAG: hypothetical protein ACOX5R_06460 [bacterium]|jgi:hypothetical protein
MNQSRIICAGFNDLQVLQKGWYGVERSPEGIYFRASSAHAEIPCTGLKGKLNLTLFLSCRAEHTRQPLQVNIFTTKEDSVRWNLNTNHWTTRTGTLERVENGIIHIEVENPWSPDALYQNGDVRSLGILLSAIRLEPVSAERTLSASGQG